VGVFHPIPQVDVIKAGSFLDGPEVAVFVDIRDTSLVSFAVSSGTV